MIATLACESQECLYFWYVNTPVVLVAVVDVDIVVVVSGMQLTIA